jgi:hypothetical protein
MKTDGTFSLKQLPFQLAVLQQKGRGMILNNLGALLPPVICSL